MSCAPIDGNRPEGAAPCAAHASVHLQE